MVFIDRLAAGRGLPALQHAREPELDSTTFAPLQLTVRASRGFSLCVAAITLVTAALAAIAIGVSLQSEMLASLAFFFVIATCCFMFRLQLKPYIGELLLHHSGYAKTPVFEGHLLPRSPVNALFCVLTIQPDVAARTGWRKLLPRKQHSLVVMRDAVSANDYRRLRLLLRWGTFSPPL
jgi:hypothetical protein